MKYTILKGISDIGVAAAVSTMKGEGPWKDPGPAGHLAYEGLGQALLDSVIYINNNTKFSDSIFQSEYSKDSESLSSFSPDRMVRPCQSHTDRILKVTEDMGGMGVTGPTPEPEADGLVTNIPGMVLCVVTADCVPVALLDPVHKAVGMVHSGWKGTAAGISVNALQMMEKEYGTDPSDVVISIGPHICKNCYEVGEELIPRFEEYFSPEDIKSFFIPVQAHKSAGTTAVTQGKYLLNMSQAISSSLIREGVCPDHIHISSRCTLEDPDLNSYRRCRRNGEDFDGRNLSAIVLLDK